MEPVTGFYRELLPALAQDFALEVVVSTSVYRGSRPPLDEVMAAAGVKVRHVWSGRQLYQVRALRPVVMLIYLVYVAVVSICRPASISLVLSQPPLLAVWFRLLHRVRGDRYICHVMDVYPDVLYVGRDGVGPWRKWIERLMVGAWNYADTVVVIGECMGTRLCEKGVDESRIRLIENWSDPTEIRPVAPADNRLRESLGLSEAFVVGYSGNMGVSHDFDDLLAAAESLRHRADIRFFLSGGGVRREYVEKRVIDRSLTNVVICGFFPFDQISLSLSLPDVHVVSLRPTFTGLVVPSKIYGCLAAGRPAIFLGESESHAAKVAQAAGGAVLAPGSSHRLASLIERLAASPDEMATRSKQARGWSEEADGARKAIQAYREILDRIVRSLAATKEDDR